MFSHLIGNSTAKQLLEHMAEKGSVPCSLLFYGPASACKKEFAIALARRLLATHKKEPPDLHLLLPEGEKTLHHPITAIRALIQEASLPPFEAPCKVFIIDDAEKMLPASCNALLKTLEEPPEKT